MKLHKRVPKHVKPNKRQRAILNWFMNLKPGDFVYDCQGFNEVVDKVYVCKIYLRNGEPVKGPTKRWCISMPGSGLSDIFFVGGGIACHPEPAHTVEQIVQRWKAFGETYPNHPIGKLAREGKPICDERGIVLPELAGKTGAFVTE